MQSPRGALAAPRRWSRARRCASEPRRRGNSPACDSNEQRSGTPPPRFRARARRRGRESARSEAAASSPVRGPSGESVPSAPAARVRACNPTPRIAHEERRTSIPGSRQPARSRMPESRCARRRRVAFFRRRRERTPARAARHAARPRHSSRTASRLPRLGRRRARRRSPPAAHDSSWWFSPLVTCHGTRASARFAGGAIGEPAEGIVAHLIIVRPASLRRLDPEPGAQAGVARSRAPRQ